MDHWAVYDYHWNVPIMKPTWAVFVSAVVPGGANPTELTEAEFESVVEKVEELNILFHNSPTINTEI